MKCLFILLIILQYSCVTTSQSMKMAITRTDDTRLPTEVKAKLVDLVNPSDVKNFQYKDSKIVTDSSLASIQQSVALIFSEGKIVGTVTTIKSSVGYEPEKKTYTVAICYSYCCVDEDGKKDCTTNYQEFLKNKQSDKCKKTTSYPCE